MGLSEKYLGFEYIVFAVGILQKREGQMQMKVLYREIARRFHTSTDCVERDIRTAVKVLFANGGLGEIMRRTAKGKEPGNAEVLYFLAYFSGKFCPKSPVNLEKIGKISS